MNAHEPARWCVIALALSILPGVFLASAPGVQFDATQAAGIAFEQRNSATPSKYLLETMGGGVAQLDYDNVTFTKWRTVQIPPPPAVTVRTLFAGIVGGDLGDGDFAGEVLDRKVSTPCAS